MFSLYIQLHDETGNHDTTNVAIEITYNHTEFIQEILEWIVNNCYCTHAEYLFYIPRIERTSCPYISGFFFAKSYKASLCVLSISLRYYYTNFFSFKSKGFSKEQSRMK
jgi:hypothetical protein